MSGEKGANLAETPILTAMLLQQLKCSTPTAKPGLFMLWLQRKIAG